jgi:trigger factor
VLGQGRWLKDFENGIVGMRAGETREVAVVFPADYHAKELAGKTASFAITLHKVSAPVLPEVDAAFAKTLGVEDGDLTTLRKEIKENLEREARRRVRAHIREQAMEKLLQAADFPLPGALLEGEIGRLAARALDDLAARGVKVPEGASLGPELFQEQAQRRVKLGLIFASLVEKHALHARPEQVRAMVDEQAQSFEKPEEVVQWAYSSSERLDEIEALVVEDNVVAWVLERARVSDKPTALDELMGSA